MGYSLCIMAEIQNGLIVGIFGVLLSGFLPRKTLNGFLIKFSHALWNFHFRSKVRIVHGL